MGTSHPILVLSNIIIDDVVLPDGVRCPDMLGGAAAYAAIGAAGYWPSVGIVAGVGGDFANVGGDRLTSLGIRTEGLLERDRFTIRNTLVYGEDSERTETPRFGAMHFERMQLTPDDIPDVLLPAAGTYLFRDLATSFWEALQRRRMELGTTLWELQASVATANDWPQVRARLANIDLFSLNLTEAAGLFGTRDPEQAIGEILNAGAKAVILRMGASGALIATSSEALRLHPPASPIIDVTGAGNSFCGGFLAQWCATGSLDSAARAAAAAAALCMSTFGPPARLDKGSLDAWAAATRIEPFGSIPRRG
jgi:sugar/nucleoside kinase (ribokinase family)